MVKVEEIMKLSVEEKISLIEKIWESLDSEEESFLTKEQQEELDRRIERHERGEGKTFTWEEIEARLKLK